MNKCRKCKREYDSSLDIIEDVELLECLSRYMDVDLYCPVCLEDLELDLVDLIEEWKFST